MSSVDGDEVAQIYVAGETGAGHAIRDLNGFERVHLGAGEARTVQFHIPIPKKRNERLTISIGGGQPLPQWTRGHFVQKTITP